MRSSEELRRGSWLRMIGPSVTVRQLLPGTAAGFRGPWLTSLSGRGGRGGVMVVGPQQLTDGLPARNAGHGPCEVAACGRLHDVVARAQALLARHGLVGWGFAFDRAKRRGGACHFVRRQITMAAGFAATAEEAEIEDTLLHEIAHALVGRRAPSRRGLAGQGARDRLQRTALPQCSASADPSLIARLRQRLLRRGQAPQPPQHALPAVRRNGHLHARRAGLSGQALALAAARARSSDSSPSMPPRPTTSSNSER